LKRLAIYICLISLSAAFLMPVAAQTKPQAEIHSPTESAVVGGLVSVMGTVDVSEGSFSYSLSFGLGLEPNHWIPISDPRQEQVIAGRLAYWDTTRIPDGTYTLRLRVVEHGNSAGYLEALVRGIQVSNAPRTLTPVATALPSATPTPTATPTSTATPWPTLSLDDGASPMLYLTMSTRSDPLCEGEQQRFGIWVSNISMVTVTNIVLTDVLPLDSAPVLAQSTPGGSFDGDITVRWELGDLGPGQATKVELQVELKPWAQENTLFQNTARISSDQLPHLSRTESFFYIKCPWLQETAAAQPFVMPTSRATATPSPTATDAPGAPRPTLLPTQTPITFAIPEESVERTFDVLTIVIAIALGVLTIVAAVLIYRQTRRR
jgi:uncharacterized repeat protein (TIGR01451 family)